MNRKIKNLTPAQRVTWAAPGNLTTLLADIDAAHTAGRLTVAEATELRHDICCTWGILYQ